MLNNYITTYDKKFQSTKKYGSKQRIGKNLEIGVSSIKISSHPKYGLEHEVQWVAVRDADGLNVMLTDHLGSVVGVVDESGALIEESRYLPFGELRTDLMRITATDLSFTGQRALEGTGLVDYHARQYDPALRSFIQADSIIPNPFSVLDYNRYLYVHANPVRFTDPSGNRPCIEYTTKGHCIVDPEWHPSGLGMYGVSANVSNVTREHIKTVIEDVAYSFWGVLGFESYYSISSAFKAVFTNGLFFQESQDYCSQCWGETTGNLITIYKNAVRTSANFNNFLVHEIGHAFDVAVSGSLTNGYGDRVANLSATPTMPVGNFGYGCNTEIGKLCHWIQGYHSGFSGYDIEQTADMFLGWVYDYFGEHYERKNWMYLWMHSLLKTGLPPSPQSQYDCYENSGIGCKGY